MENDTRNTTTQEITLNNRKRKHNTEETFTKRSCEDGFSWWTSMMLGVAPERQKAYSRVNVRNVNLKN